MYVDTHTEVGRGREGEYEREGGGQIIKQIVHFFVVINEKKTLQFFTRIWYARDFMWFDLVKTRSGKTLPEYKDKS